MLRAVEMVGGGLLGFIAGSFLCAPLIAHVFSPAVITWDATSCPPGIYTITSTATNVETSQSFTTRTVHVRLPASSVRQEFSDLPFGQYLISAIARDVKGRSFEASQSLNTAGLASRSRGRQTPMSFPSSLSKGRASAAVVPRATNVTVSDISAPATSTAVAESVVLPQPVETASTKFFVSSDIAELLGAFESRGRGRRFNWKSVTLIDTDEDGVVDSVRIESVDGHVWFIS